MLVLSEAILVLSEAVLVLSEAVLVLSEAVLVIEIDGKIMPNEYEHEHRRKRLSTSTTGLRNCVLLDRDDCSCSYRNQD